MEGPDGHSNAQSQGIMYRSLHYLFENRSGMALTFQYVQLYNADFLDLLDTSNVSKKLKVEEGRDYMTVKGAKVETATDANEMLSTIAHGASFRASGKTNMNDASSRSHAILIVMVPKEAEVTEDRAEEGQEDDGIKATTAKVKTGKKKLKGAAKKVMAAASATSAMYMVDLAGSERNKRSGATGQRFVEARSINTALSALGRVVSSLVELDGKRAAHIRSVHNSRFSR